MLSRLFTVMFVFAAAVGCNSTSNGLFEPTPTAPTPTVVALTLSITTSGDRSGLARTWNYHATAIAHYSDGSSQDVTTTATWTSSNQAVARISPAGTITGEGPGMTEIRATYQGVTRTVFFCLEINCV